jgi:hypothetical protein
MSLRRIIGIAAAFALVAACASAQDKASSAKKGVPPPPVRKPPSPPSGPTPHRKDGKVDFSGVWVLSGSPLLPSDPSYQGWAKKLYEERKANKGKDDPEAFCLPDGAVRVTPLPYKFVQASQMMVVLSEGNTHSYRRFFMDGRPHNLDLDPNTYTGDSIARWDGETLVVETIGFNDKTWLDSTGKPHSEDLRVVERYRRPDLGHLTVNITLVDSKAFTKPYTFDRTFTLAQGWEIQEYVCQAILDGVETK